MHTLMVSITAAEEGRGDDQANHHGGPCAVERLAQFCDEQGAEKQLFEKRSMRPNNDHDRKMCDQIALNAVEPRSLVRIHEVDICKQRHQLGCDDEDAHGQQRQSADGEPDLRPEEPKIALSIALTVQQSSRATHRGQC